MNLITTLQNYLQYRKDKRLTDKLYRKTFSTDINWAHPTKYSEKLHIFKLTKEAEELWPYADKYEVIKYVEQKVGKSISKKLYGVYESVEEIDFNTLPESFVLKATHGTGWNIICPKKSELDWPEAKTKLSDWLSTNYYNSGQERQYIKIPPRIICEEYLYTSDNNLKDYKFFCFGGKVAFIHVDTGRFSDHKQTLFYDPDWNQLPIGLKKIKKETKIKRPAQISEMLAIARTLSAPFRHVRVDLYNVGKKIYFGELTFTSGNGTYVFDPPEYDEMYGSLFKLA